LEINMQISTQAQHVYANGPAAGQPIPGTSWSAVRVDEAGFLVSPRCWGKTEAAAVAALEAVIAAT
jgi:hypothetical protein